jgi:hypothetical protein
MRITTAQPIWCINENSLDETFRCEIAHTFETGTDEACSSATRPIDGIYARSAKPRTVLKSGQMDVRPQPRLMRPGAAWRKGKVDGCLSIWAVTPE